jgi:hypothetical protein
VEGRKYSKESKKKEPNLKRNPCISEHLPMALPQLQKISSALIKKMQVRASVSYIF